jgi:hypothetical protein
MSASLSLASNHATYDATLEARVQGRSLSAPYDASTMTGTTFRYPLFYQGIYSDFKENPSSTLLNGH